MYSRGNQCHSKSLDVTVTVSSSRAPALRARIPAGVGIDVPRLTADHPLPAGIPKIRNHCGHRLPGTDSADIPCRLRECLEVFFGMVSLVNDKWLWTKPCFQTQTDVIPSIINISTWLSLFWVKRF